MAVFGLIVGTRGFFNPKLAQAGRKAVMDRLEQTGHSVIVLGEDETPFGCVETREHAYKCARLFKDNADKIEGLIITLPNFGDEIGVVESVTLSNLDVPILVHAFDDELDKMDIANRRDAFCGKLSVCNNLYQRGIKFTDTTYHTTSVDSKEFHEDVERFGGICGVYRGIKGARIAQIGTRPGAFRTVRYSEKLLERSGITVVPVDLSEIIFMAESISDERLISDKTAEIKAYGNVDCTGYACDSKKGMINSAKLTIAVENWMTENECAAGCIQCWDSLLNNFHCAACLTMSMLGEKGIPFACETDVQGAVAMYALYLANKNPVGYLDWNNSYGDNRDMCINFHCSNYPKSFFGDGYTPDISCLDILGQTLGYENCFGAMKGRVQKGACTFMNIQTDDYAGRIKAYVGDGEFMDGVVNTVGSPAICKIDNLQSLMSYLCKNGFHHHVAMNRGLSAEIIREVFGNYFGWDVYRHI